MSNKLVKGVWHYISKALYFVSICLFAIQVNAQLQQKHDFNIPSLPVNEALNRVANISDVSFLVNYDLVDNINSEPVNGRYTTQQVINRLLITTGLKGELVNNTVFLIKPIEEISNNTEANSVLPQNSAQTSTASSLSLTDTAFLRAAKLEAVQSEFEHISITGSYIKKRTYNDVGAIDIISRTSIDASAPTGRLVDFLRFLPTNSGNFSGLSPGGDGGAQEGRLGAGTVDLRGLGGGATLVLINGKRQAGFPLALDRRVDVNSLTPNIMLRSLEILNNGASAVYGSDAVAGVVNFITRSDFEGVELRADGRGTYGATIEPFDHYNSTLGLLFGSSKNKPLHIVAGFEYFKQDNLVFGEVEQVPLFTSQGASSFGNPGSYVLPVRNNAGEIVGNQTVADPFCQNVIDANISNDPNFPQTPTSLDVDANLCRITFPNQAFLLDEERWASRIETQWSIHDDLRIKNAFGYTRVIATDIFNASAPVLNFPTVLGEHPNNPFIAIDSNGHQLFARDENGDGIADRDAENSVVLDPSGIAFNEDVLFRGRPYSATNFGVVGAKQEVSTLRGEFDITGEIKELSWLLGLNYSRQKLIRRSPDSIFSEFQDALNGEGGPESNLYFNPFGSSILDPNTANDPILADAIQVTLFDQHNTETTTLNGLVSGDIYAMPSGPLSAAFGFQLRTETLTQDFDQLKNISQVSFFGNGDVDLKASQSIGALFFEAAIPVINNKKNRFDISIAGRYERNIDRHTRTFNPKISLHYRNEYYSLNGSYSTSFLAPSLFQTGGVTAQFANVEDPISGTSEQVSTQLIGNRTLKDQDSTSASFGIDVFPVKNIGVNLSYWRFNFDDLIAASLTQTIVTANPNGPLVIRDDNNIISLVRRPFFNAGTIETDGIDFTVNYDMPTKSFGHFILQAQGTFVSHYDVQDEKGGVVINGVGSDNNGNIGSAIAQWRTNTRISWLQGNHSAIATGRYYSEIERVRGNFQGVADAMWVVDAQYSYLIETTKADLLITLGARNIFNNEPNIVLTTDNQYFVGTYQDPSGRVVYASAKINF